MNELTLKSRGFISDTGITVRPATHKHFHDNIPVVDVGVFESEGAASYSTALDKEQARKLAFWLLLWAETMG